MTNADDTKTPKDYINIYRQVSLNLCHRHGWDAKNDAPICDWDGCPRKVGMDCYLPLPEKNLIEFKTLVQCPCDGAKRVDALCAAAGQCAP